MKADELVNAIKGYISTMENRIAEDNGKYVMVSDEYIQVAEGEGLNGTNVNVRCSACACRIVCFYTEAQARRSADYHLINGAGERILLRPMKAEDFFAMEIDRAEDLVQTLTETAL
ncbi:MAG: hypothetical protein NC453_10535 [Muribaculum sp.]|nr:hypothetical protein [Muribaculum sp.]